MKKIAKALASRKGGGGPGPELLVAALDAAPDACNVLLDLLADERDDDPALLETLLFMFEHAVENIRFGVERRRPEASAQADELRRRLTAMCRDGTVTQPRLLTIIARMTAARLDPGDELRDAAAAMSDATRVGVDLDFDETLHQLDVMAVTVGNAFQLAAMLDEATAGFPDAQRGAFAAACFSGETDHLRDAALASLLDPSPAVRRQVIRALERTAADGGVSAASLRRMVTLRNWLPADERPLLDAAVREARRRAPAPEPPATAAEIRGVFVSACDGAGAQTAMIDGKEGRKSALLALLFKRHAGVRDAWAMHGAARRQVDDMIGGARDGVDLMPSSLDFVAKMTAHYLGVAAESGEPPPFGLLDVLETLGLGEAQPARLTLPELLTELSDGLPADAADPTYVEARLAESARWSRDYIFTESWFDDDDETAELAARPRQSRPALVRAILERRLEPRRLEWAEIIGWTGLVLREAERVAAATGKGKARRAVVSAWPAFAVVVRELAAGRPTAEIPAMVDIAAHSADAFKPQKQQVYRLY